MKSLKEIREDLRDVRFYYSKKALFDALPNEICSHEVLEKVKLYNDMAQKAPLRLFEVYVVTYIEVNSQESAAIKLNYAYQYLHALHTELIMFFYDQLKKEGK